jgi:hypothetical protein
MFITILSDATIWASLTDNSRAGIYNHSVLIKATGDITNDDETKDAQY